MNVNKNLRGLAENLMAYQDTLMKSDQIRFNFNIVSFAVSTLLPLVLQRWNRIDKKKSTSDMTSLSEYISV